MDNDKSTSNAATDTNADAPTGPQSLTSTCHCRSIRITFPAPREPLNECLCSICHRYGALWAYYQPSEVQIHRTSSDASDADDGAARPGTKTEIYTWGPRTVEFHRCPTCGCVTHWEPADKKRRAVGVNCRLMERAELGKLERRQSEGPEDDEELDW